MKNVGALPAKDVRTQIFLCNGENKDLRYDLKEDSTTITAIFPKQIVVGSFKEGFLPVSLLNQNPYIHLMIGYYDAAGNEYYFKLIALVKDLALYDSSIAPEEKHIWVDFD